MPAATLPVRLYQPALPRSRRRSHRCVGALALMLVLVAGCAVFNPNEQIIRVRTARNPAEAARLTLVGIKALDNGEPERAKAKFFAAIDADGTYGPAHNNLGLLHFDCGDLYQAVLEFEQAMDLMPQDPVAYYNLGLTLEAAGRTFEAMDLYSQAVEMDPNNPHFLGNLVRLRVRLGEDDPMLITELQDLILIETRPEWRRWADRQLALVYNPTLDRGPAAPEFETDREEGDAIDDEALLRSRIIELTPNEAGARRNSEIELLPPDHGSPGRTGPSKPAQPPATPQMLPIPRVPTILDQGSLDTLPPSISP